jgi:large subunit ribosomal protein L24e
MRIHHCYFCSVSIYPGHGVTFVRNDSTVFRFCARKCRSLFNKRLNPRKIKWTKISRKVGHKDLVEDPIFGLERRVHAPPIYDREVLLQTVDAIPKIIALKMKKEGSFIADRILSAQEKSKTRDLQFIEKYNKLLVNETNKDLNEVKVVKKKEREVEYI